MAAAAGACLFPCVRASSASPAGRVNMAFIGIGNRGQDVFSIFWHYRDLINVVALCDVQMGASHTQRVLSLCPGVKRYTDFRKMFDEMGKTIDAVVIATPDFSHFPAAMVAMSLGKAVFVEKPMGNTFREVSLMAAAAERYKVVTQMGNQGHSEGNYWQMRELVARGFLKDVERIDAWMCSARRWHKWGGVQMREMPGGDALAEHLDWDLWQSQRPARSFSTHYIQGDWRSFYAYGNGALGDWGAHLFDAAHEFLALGLPVRIETLRNEGRTKAVFPMASTTAFVFPARGPGMPECRLTWYDGIGNFPAFPEKRTASKWKPGAQGAMLTCSDGRIFSRKSHGDVLWALAGLDPADPAVKKIMRDYPRGKSGHYLNFIKAVRGEEKTTSPFSVAGPLSQVMTLGALAQRMAAKRLTFDLSSSRFTGDGAQEANAYLDGPPPRKGWEFLYRL